MVCAVVAAQPAIDVVVTWNPVKHKIKKESEVFLGSLNVRFVIFSAGTSPAGLRMAGIKLIERLTGSATKRHT
jgi:hypothetical protein